MELFIVWFITIYLFMDSDEVQSRFILIFIRLFENPTNNTKM